MTSWSKRLTAIVNEKGISRRDLAMSIGVTYDSISKYMRGDVDHPRKETLRRLAEVLEIDEEWLIYGVEKSAPKNDLTVVAGVVAVGVWIETDRATEIPLMADRINAVSLSHPAAEQIAFQVQGNSLEYLASHGDYIVCIDVTKSSRKPREGDLVVIRRTKFGSLSEISARYVASSERGPILTASRLKPGGAEVDAIGYDEAEILGIALFVYKPLVTE